jgi:hypothetical protein
MGKGRSKGGQEGKYKHHEMILKITIHYNKK